MAKSIRSKSKRKFRSEFRQTIGNDFYQKNMKQIQTKLKESVSNQTMSLESLERLSKAFDTSSSTPTTTDAETTTVVEDPKQLKGEYVAQNTGRNKSLYKKSGKRRKKHTLKAASKHTTTGDSEDVNTTTAAAAMDGVVVEKRRPRYFVQF